MGQYRFSVYAHWQIQFGVKVDKYEIAITFLFITVHFATTKEAKGYNLFDLIEK
jgi:hypothetical protein